MQDTRRRYREMKRQFQRAPGHDEVAPALDAYGEYCAGELDADGELVAADAGHRVDATWQDDLDATWQEVEQDARLWDADEVAAENDAGELAADTGHRDA